MASGWSRLAVGEYSALSAGSIDGTDTRAHDCAVYRAMGSKHTPPAHIKSNSRTTLFVARLPTDITKHELCHQFDKFAPVKSATVVRDIVTGFSKGYAFVEFNNEKDVDRVLHKCSGMKIDGKEILLDYEVGRSMKGWVPRRFGGGWGGKKESGQLRFGCRDRPWKRPLESAAPDVQDTHHNSRKKHSRSNDSERRQNRDYNITRRKE